MRIEGTIKTWNDERGFGFIEPTQGGQEIFVHVKAFRTRSGRPQPGQRVTFEIELNPDGKKRARDVEIYRPVGIGTRRRKNSPAQWGTASYFVIPAFLALYVVIGVLWRVPAWVAWLYAVASSPSPSTRATSRPPSPAGGAYPKLHCSYLVLSVVGRAPSWRSKYSATSQTRPHFAESMSVAASSTSS